MHQPLWAAQHCGGGRFSPDSAKVLRLDVSPGQGWDAYMREREAAQPISSHSLIDSQASISYQELHIPKIESSPFSAMYSSYLPSSSRTGPLPSGWVPQRRPLRLSGESQITKDAELAARLQAEENARRPSYGNTNSNSNSNYTLNLNHNHNYNYNHNNMPSQKPRRKPHHSIESDAALAARLQAEEDARATQRPHRPQQQGKSGLAHTSYSSPLPTAMSTGRRPKNKRPKKVRWDYPLAVEVQ